MPSGVCVALETELARVLIVCLYLVCRIAGALKLKSMKKKVYETPEVETLEISVERGFAVTGGIDNPQEEAEDPNYWS